jgi:hypothetical protein
MWRLQSRLTAEVPGLACCDCLMLFMAFLHYQGVVALCLTVTTLILDQLWLCCACLWAKMCHERCAVSGGYGKQGPPLWLQQNLQLAGCGGINPCVLVQVSLVQVGLWRHVCSGHQESICP